MSEIRCQCDACHGQFKVPAKYAGLKGKCPKCGAVMMVPALDAEGQDAAPAAAPAPVKPNPIKVDTAKAAPAKAASPSGGGFPAVNVGAGKPAGASGGLGINIAADTASPRKRSVSGDVTHTAAGESPRGRHAKSSPSPSMLLIGGGIGAILMVALTIGVLFVILSRGDTETAKNNQPQKPPSESLLENPNADANNKEDFSSDLPTVKSNENTNAPPKENGSGDFADLEVGSEALDPVPDGFAGWTQTFLRAQEKAHKQEKELLILFTCSDADPDCLQFLENVVKKDEFKKWSDAKYICVVIDFPRGEAARGKVLDLAQNMNLQSKYGIHFLPTVVLAKPDGLAYASISMQGGASNPQEFLAKVEEAKKAGEEMEQYFVKAAETEGDERYQAVIKAAEYLIEKDMAAMHGDRLAKYLDLAKEKDPDNKEGKYELIFEVTWLSRFRQAMQDSSQLEKVLSELDQWTDKMKFKDQNRGARLFLVAGMHFGNAGNEEKAQKYIQNALAYEPTDPKLTGPLAQLKRVFSGVISSGTGWIAAPGGYLMTNNHVIAGDGKPYVLLPGTTDKEVPAEIIARDEKRDMAILKIDLPEGLKWEARPLRGGTAILSLDIAVYGFPLGEEGLKFTKGAIMGKPTAANENMLMLDCRVNPGNSGGPLCDMGGNVIGMVTAKTIGSANIDSAGLAIPAEDLLAFLKKHVPSYEPAPAIEENEGSWAGVTPQVEPTVMMIRMKRS